jgi:hypothetical protein
VRRAELPNRIVHPNNERWRLRRPSQRSLPPLGSQANAAARNEAGLLRADTAARGYGAPPTAVSFAAGPMFRIHLPPAVSPVRTTGSAATFALRSATSSTAFFSSRSPAFVGLSVSGTSGSNPLSSSGESIANLTDGRVGRWRGGVRSTMSVAAPLVWRCVSVHHRRPSAVGTRSWFRGRSGGRRG